ncbi:MAG: hypothetical protein ACK42L_02330 [Thermoanaerobaculum sp.]
MKVVLVAPRTVAPGSEGARRNLSCWLEVTLVLRLSLPEWGVEELVFAHWAAPWEGKTAGLAWRRFEPGRWAALPERPEGVNEVSLSVAEAESVVREVVELLPSEMYHQPSLGLVSAFDESFSAFRHRCLKAVARTVQEGLLRRDPAAAQAVAQVVDGIQRKALASEDRQLLEARVGFAFYPEGKEPSLPSENLMIEGGKGWRG